MAQLCPPQPTLTRPSRNSSSPPLPSCYSLMAAAVQGPVRTAMCWVIGEARAMWPPPLPLLHDRHQAQLEEVEAVVV